MKRIFYMLFLVIFFVSCNGEQLPVAQEPPQEEEPSSTVARYSFLVEAQQAAPNDIKRYLVELYESDDLSTTPIRSTHSTGRFDLELKKGVDYRCLFWADGGEDTYDAKNLQAVKQVDERLSGRVAYCASITVNSNAFNGSVVLQRAVAELSFIDKAGRSAADNLFKITYPYTSATFNVSSGAVAYSAGEAVRTIAGATSAWEQRMVCATDFVLAPTIASTLTGLKFQRGTAVEQTKASTSIQANRHTKITGEHTTPTEEGASMRFTIDVAEPTDLSCTLPFSPEGRTGAYTLTVDWGDGSPHQGLAPGVPLAPAIKHTYTEAKTYQVTITSSQGDYTQVQMPPFEQLTSTRESIRLKSMDTPLLNMGVTNLKRRAFSSRYLTSIHEDLFINNPQITDFQSCFSSCDALTEIPASLFANNPLATNFQNCFASCTKLVLNANIFCNEATESQTRFAGQRMTFYRCFENCGTNASIPIGGGGVAPALWSYTTHYSSTYNCFFDVTKVTNAGDIPMGWK